MGFGRISKVAAFVFNAFVIITCISMNGSADADDSQYAVVVSTATQADQAWGAVVSALVAKHNAQVFTYEKNVDETLTQLQTQFPRYSCFVATREEANRAFVQHVHQLTRQLDDDPYTDTLWGILTGFDAGDALRIAKHDQPLTVHKVAAGTELAMEMVEEGIWYCELQQHRMVQKAKAGIIEEKKGPADTTKALVDTLNDYQPDLFVTSGHATERNWQIGFRYRNGYFKSKAGQLSGLDTQGSVYSINSPNPKLYLPIGNCLMGNIDGPDAMALAWMHSAGVNQMIGYTVPTWFGYGGWGCLDYFIEQPGRYTFAEAFHANHHALNHCLVTGEGNQRGLAFDRDVVALYGDPAWNARMATQPNAYTQSLTESDGTFTFTIEGNRGEASFQPINNNGSQRGWRPMIAYLPYRITNTQVLEGDELSPVITDDFVLVPNPREHDPTQPYVVRFTADPMN